MLEKKDHHPLQSLYIGSPKRIALLPRSHAEIIVGHIELGPLVQILAGHHPFVQVQVAGLGLVVMAQAADGSNGFLNGPEFERADGGGGEEGGEEEVVGGGDDADVEERFGEAAGEGEARPARAEDDYSGFAGLFGGCGSGCGCGRGLGGSGAEEDAREGDRRAALDRKEARGALLQEVAAANCQSCHGRR